MNYLTNLPVEKLENKSFVICTSFICCQTLKCDDIIKGPMSVLQKCVENQTRIKVTTRKLNGTRGFMEGVLIAYDKHWNLALADVDETYSRPRHRKPEYDNGKKVEKSLQPERMGQSVIRIVKTRRNTELCQRHIPQIVLRGEHVILIQPLFSS